MLLLLLPVNADKALLPARTLKYSWANSGCSPPQGPAAMGNLLQGGSKIDAVMGPGCSAVCEVTSYLSGGQNLPQIGYSCKCTSLVSFSGAQAFQNAQAHCYTHVTTAGHGPSAMDTAGHGPSAMDTVRHGPSATGTAGHRPRAMDAVGHGPRAMNMA